MKVCRDCDAHDALAWLLEYGADWCEPYDLPDWSKRIRNIKQEAPTEPNLH